RSHCHCNTKGIANDTVTCSRHTNARNANSRGIRVKVADLLTLCGIKHHELSPELWKYKGRIVSQAPAHSLLGGTEKKGPGTLPRPVQAMSSLPSVGDMQAAFAFSINAPRHRRKEKEAHFDARSQPSTPGPGSPSRPLVDLPEGPHEEPSRLMPTLSAIPSGSFQPQKSVLQFDLPNGAGDDTEDVKREAVRSLSGVVEDNEQGDKNEENLLMRSPPSSPQMDNMISLSKKSNTVILHQYNTIEDAEPPGSLEDLGCSICVKVPWLAACLPVVLSATSLAFMYHEDIVGHNFTMVSAAVYSLCSVSCLWLLRRALLSEELVLAVGKLHVFVDTFKNQWGKRSRQEQCWSFAVWLILVLGFVAGEAYEEWKEMELPDTGYANSRLILKALCTVSFGLSSGILVLVAYVQCHFLLGLDTSLDCWCASLLDEPDFSLGVESWNCLQALLKCIGREMASSFLMMQILGAAGFIYFLTSAVTVAFQRSFDREVMLMEGLRSLPLLLHFLLEMHVFSRGATLTQKCRIIPSFVNQIPSATLLNPARSYLVQFVTDSSAGFLVRDVKLTPEMFLKIFVLIGGLLINCPAIFRQPRLGHKRSLVTAGTLNWQSGLAYCHALISDLVLGGLFLVGPVWPRPAAYTSTRRFAGRVKSSSLGPRGQLEAEEFRKVLVELTGREGYNAAAVNGKWHFWKVKSGRVAFQRELSLEGAAPEGAVPSLRLFLFYVPQTDTWIISDAPDASGSVVADCGPVLGGTDLQQSWRVWDGDGWKEETGVEPSRCSTEQTKHR
ncbi:unnamed protein product, partial [Effrenium voratum]